MAQSSSNGSWIKALKKLAREVDSKYGPSTVILYGPRAKGCYSATTETNLLVVTSEEVLHAPVEDEIMSLAKSLGVPSPQVRVLSLAKAVEELPYDSMLLDAVSEGKAIVDSLGAMERLKEALLRLKQKGWKKINGKWKMGALAYLED